MYTKIFDEVVSILHEDYAGCIDKKGWDDPDFFRNKINQVAAQDTLNDEKFVEIVRDYLLDFKDLHMSFRNSMNSETTNATYAGFKVRRHRDLLYVVSSEKESRVKPGYVISELDGKRVAELVNVHKRQLMETKAKRENWGAVLSEYKYAKVNDRSGNTFTLELAAYEKEPFVPEYSLHALSESTLFMKLTDFTNHNEISRLIQENTGLLSDRKNLIIDVRVNKGGDDLAYFDLLPFLFDGEVIDLKRFDEGKMLTNCTYRNVELRKRMFHNLIASVDDNATKSQVNAFMKQLDENKGKGFVELGSAGMDESFLLKTRSGPDRVIILTDVYCGSSGDSFVEVCKNSGKVTVIGRPTLGLNDYANLAVMEWENKFELWYPTSKLSIVDEGKGMSGVGIQPDIYIPWNPGHIDKDADLEKAFELIDDKIGGRT
ncbi:S41 family peptidase [Virgibacillus siamensis]|uniref:S41 family peptidase n=1 Tax=Virgibacillus siamensis TaxID=480071 RepID=UPI0009856FF6|nr:S41 family peptidase [Virgibacillus siamensis]